MPSSQATMEGGIRIEELNKSTQCGLSVCVFAVRWRGDLEKTH